MKKIVPRYENGRRHMSPHWVLEAKSYKFEKKIIEISETVDYNT